MDVEKRLEILKKSLVAIGFSIQEAEKQIEEVGKIITMAILEKLLKEKAAAEKLTAQNFQDYLKSNFTAEYLKVVVDQESNRIVEEYRKAVSVDLPSDKK